MHPVFESAKWMHEMEMRVVPLNSSAWKHPNKRKWSAPSSVQASRVWGGCSGQSFSFCFSLSLDIEAP